MWAGVSFYALNQQLLGGNQRQVSCDLVMQGVEQDTEERHELVFPLKANDALVDVDVLLSYEWLAQQNVHIHARQHGLTIGRAGLSFWVAEIRAGAKVRGHANGVCVVRKIPIQQPGQGPTPNQSGDKVPGAWETSPSNYVVRPEFAHEFVQRLKVQPTLDCFSAVGEAQCDSFFSAKQDGLEQRWSPKEILWNNPPWDLWPQAAAKLLASQCTAICVVPACSAECVRSLVHTATRRLYVEMGTRLFQRNGKKCAGTRWGTCLLRNDGDVRPRLDDTRAYNSVFLPQWREPGQLGAAGIGPEGPDPAPAVRGRKFPEGTQTGESLRVLDLFSGTGSVSRVFVDEGYEVVFLDIDPKFNPTIVTDVLEWDFRAAYPVGHFDVVFACPPCDQMSRARTTKPRDMITAERLVVRTLEIVRHFRPARW